MKESDVSDRKALQPATGSRGRIFLCPGEDGTLEAVSRGDMTDAEWEEHLVLERARKISKSKYPCGKALRRARRELKRRGRF